MPHNTAVISILALLIASSCGRGNHNIPDEASVRVVEEVDQLFHDYFSAVKNDGLTAEFKFLDHSSDFFWVPPGYDHPLSYDSVAAILTKNARLYISVENTMDSLRIIPLNSQLANYTAILHSVIKDTSGNALSLQLIESGIVIKRNDGWKLLSGQTSLINQ